MKEKDALLNQGELEIQSVKAREKTKRQLEREKQKRELDRYKQVETQLQRQTERFMVMRDLLDAGCSVKVPSGSTESVPRTPSAGALPQSRISDPRVTGTPSLRVCLLLTCIVKIMMFDCRSILRDLQFLHENGVLVQWTQAIVGSITALPTL